MARRASGDVISPLPLALLIPTAVALVAWAWLLRLPDSGTLDSRFSFWLPLIVILLFALALSYPGTRIFDWLVWLAAIAAALVGPPRVLPSRRRPAVNARKRRGQQFLIQNLKRYRCAEGRESVVGTLAAEFTAGQRVATLVAGFCPPFEFLPHVTAHVTSEASASVKVAQVRHNGVQLEVRLARAAAARQVVTVELLAAESATG
jgi:hypothetical protein